MTEAIPHHTIRDSLGDALRGHNAEFVARLVAGTIGGGTAEQQLAAAKVELTRKSAERDYLFCYLLEVVIRDLEATVRPDRFCECGRVAHTCRFIDDPERGHADR